MQNYETCKKQAKTNSTVSWAKSTMEGEKEKQQQRKNVTCVLVLSLRSNSDVIGKSLRQNESVG